MGITPNKHPVIVDTSFLLPTLGFDINNSRIYEGIRRLQQEGVILYYTDVSLLEATWFAKRAIRAGTFDEAIFVKGLNALDASPRFQKCSPSNRVFSMACRLYELGHHDMIDNILYSTALDLNIWFCTLDSGLKRFLAQRRLDSHVRLM